jgi:hypothetical protein
MVRCFKDQNLRGPDLSKAEANDKTQSRTVQSAQRARLLLFLRERMAEKDEVRGSPMAIAVDTTLRLWEATLFIA